MAARFEDGIPARFARQSLYSFKALFGWLDPKIYILAKVASPVLQLCFFALMASFAYGGKDLSAYVLGNAFALCGLNCVFSVGNVVDEERMMGTLPLVLMTSSSRFLVFVGRGALHILDAILTVAIALAAGALIFGVDYGRADMGVLSLSALASVASAMGFGLFIGSFALISRDMGLVTNVALLGITALSGASFPTAALPPFLRAVAAALPLTRGIQAGRLCLDRAGAAEAWPFIGGELVLGAAYMLAGFLLLSVCERMARIRATLDIY